MESNAYRDARAISEVEKAKVYLQYGNLSKAAAIFEQVARHCRCGVPAKKSLCLCKSLVPAITDGTFDAELRKKCICSAKSDVRCKSVAHLDALNGLAAVRETEGFVDLALIIAESMINLSPRDPKGYLRLGRLLWVQDSRNAAYLAYQQGIEVVSQKEPTHPLLPVLRKLRAKTKYAAAAGDPLKTLPLELVAMVFKNLDLRTLCRCLRVSKAWNKLLTTGDETVQSLWRIQNFGTLDDRFRPSQLRKYIQYSGCQIKELSTDLSSWFNGDEKWLRMLSIPEYRGLNVLRLVGLQIGEVIVAPPRLPKLVTLSLGFTFAASRSSMLFAAGTVSLMANSLEELTLQHVQLSPRWPKMENLKILRLCGDDDASIAAHLPLIIRATPNVEQFWVDKANLSFLNGVECPTWSHLKSLFIGRDITMFSSSFQLFFSTEKLEELHVLSTMAQSITSLFHRHPDRLLPRPKLRLLNIHYQPPATALTFTGPEFGWGWMRPGLESGSLQWLGMGPTMNPRPDWFKSDQLRFLNFEHFSISPIVHVYQLEDDFLDCLERFPNLEGIDIAKEPISHGALAKAIQKGIKTIFYRAGYYEREDLRTWAAKVHGTRFIFADSTETIRMNQEASVALMSPSWSTYALKGL